MRGSRLLGALAAALGAVACGRSAPPDLILATTTSVYETGLLDSLLARFTAESGVGVQINADQRIVAFRLLRFFFQAHHSVAVQLRNPEFFRIRHSRQ